MSNDNLRYLERLSQNYPVFAFSVIYAANKRYIWGLFLTMFLPTFQFILLLNFTEEDLSGGSFYLWYYRIYFSVSLFFLTSLVALLVGTGMYRDLISNETIVYIITKPINRKRIFLEIYGAYLVISILVTTPGIIVSHLTTEIATRLYDSSFSLSIINSIYNLFLELSAIYILIFGLGAIFVTTGQWLKRPLLINLIIAFGVIIEAFLLDLISNQFEPVYIAQNLVAKEVRGFENQSEISNRLFRFSLGNEISTWNGLGNFIIILVFTIMLGLRISTRKQFD